MSPVHDKTAVLRELQRLPNVGPSIAIDLYDLGIRQPADLRRKNPQRMYDELMAQRGQHIDRCQLYVFRALVYYSKTKQPEPELVQWWKWSDRAVETRSQ